MSTVKTCTNCGAENETVYSDCIFCKTALPSSNPDEIPTDELISKATIWVGRATLFQYSINRSNTNNRSNTKESAIAHLFNLFNQAFPVEIPRAEIIATAEKYLSLLGLRAETSEIAKANLLILSERLNKNRKKFAQGDRISRKQVAFFVVIFIIIAPFSIITSIIDSGSDNRGINHEIDRLQEIELSVQNYVAAKNYDMALITAEQLRYTDNLDQKSGQALAKQYDEKRESLKELIEKMKAQEAQ